MKRFISLFITFLLLMALGGCSGSSAPIQIAATTLPVYTFTSALCEGTGLAVGQLITENVSCLHDYTLQVSQMRTVENAEVIVTSGAGLEAFLDDVLVSSGNIIDASEGVSLLCAENTHDHEHEHGHSHEEHDPHIWLDPNNAMLMAKNICVELCVYYPQYSEEFNRNLSLLLAQLEELNEYGKTTLSALQCRELVTFHDGFSYFAQAFDLHILKAVEEESGSEPSAAELIEIINIVTENQLPAIFTEVNGSNSAASVISRETGAKQYNLDMAMSSEDYFAAMYHNIDIIKEALG